MGQPIIQAQGLVKRYKDVMAVAGVDLEVWAGECFGLLGPNGAGKTTTIRLISCVSPVTSGRLTVGGLDVVTHPRQVKAAIGVVPQEYNLDPDLTVLQNLLVYARYFDMPRDVARARAEEALALFQLEGKSQSRIDTLSGGMKRRLLIARALLHHPRLLILDEPTAGLDPQARHLVWHKLGYLLETGTTLLLSTHNMEEAARLCHRLAIMHQGRIMALGTPQELIRRYVGEEVAEVKAEEAQRLEGMGRVEEVEGNFLIFSEDGGFPAWVRERFRTRPATLEDVFLRLTGRNLTE